MKRRKLDYHDKMLLTGAGLAATIWWYMIRGVFSCLLLLLPINAWTATYYVSNTGAGTGNGSSWANAGNGFGFIRSTLSGGDTVILKPGNYYSAYLDTIPQTTSGDRTCITCSTVVNPFVGQMPACSVTAGLPLNGATATWTNVSGELWSTPFNYGQYPRLYVISGSPASATTDIVYQGFQGSTYVKGCQTYTAFLSAPRGSIYYTHDGTSGGTAQTLYVRCSDGGNPNRFTWVVSGRHFMETGWAGSTISTDNRGFFTIRGLYAYCYQYGLVYSHSSNDSIGIENVWFNGTAGPIQNNNGLCTFDEIYSAAEAGGREFTYNYDRKHWWVKNSRVQNITEWVGGADNRTAIMITYQLSHTDICSVYVDATTVGGAVEWKNRTIGGVSKGNKLRFCTIVGNTGSSRPPVIVSNFQMYDTTIGNIFSGTRAAFEFNHIDPAGKHVIYNNTFYNITENTNIFGHMYLNSLSTGCMADSLFNEFKYNVFVDVAPASRIFGANSCGGLDEWAIDSNMYWQTVDTITGSWAGVSGSTNYTLPTWRTMTTAAGYPNERRHDWYSVVADPGFTSPGALDFSRSLASTEMNRTISGRTWTLYGAWQPTVQAGSRKEVRIEGGVNLGPGTHIGSE